MYKTEVRGPLRYLYTPKKKTGGGFQVSRGHREHRKLKSNMLAVML